MTNGDADARPRPALGGGVEAAPTPHTPPFLIPCLIGQRSRPRSVTEEEDVHG